jgi:glutaredoxin
MTSVQAVRETYERCRAAVKILHTHMVRVEERDIFLSRDHRHELAERLNADSDVEVPQVFANGYHIGVSNLINVHPTDFDLFIYLNFLLSPRLYICENANNVLALFT